ncbi:MAG: exodeoxyribonuclease VII large subunit [Verrucomicrobiota bacterium]|jgi:exodeoxyribonuclease VII large subunit|nr:exodeoxyribonuclease VII large subunit [Verrucomicrobiota bacterium]
MSQSQNQWDFGELFPEEEKRQILTVSELTRRVKRELEERVGQVWVEGEITNLRRQSSGHMYFSIKDASTQVSCVIFRGTRATHKELIEDGQKVVLQGDLSVYEARGQYQLIVRMVEMQGLGALQAKFEKLKSDLNKEGLFDEAHKGDLPRVSKRIGIVTSLSGAALHDVLHVVKRRQPSLQIVLVDSRVQGKGAGLEIVQGIEWLNIWSKTEPLDLILITRGGGGLEDLWAFNEEVVARSIFASEVPVVSAVGHEIDFTISDFVADARAATPSAAAEIITAGAVAFRERLVTVSGRLRRLVSRHYESMQRQIQTMNHRLTRCHPRRQFQQKMQRVDELQDDLLRAVHSAWRGNEEKRKNLNNRLMRLRPAQILDRKRVRAGQLSDRMMSISNRCVENAVQRIAGLSGKLRLLGPDNVISRGYSIVRDAKTGAILRSVKKVKTGQKLKAIVADGEIESTVD